MEVGLKLTFTNEGWPDADKAIAELKPPAATVVIVALPDLPGGAESVLTDGVMVKLPTTANVTVRVKVVVWTVLPLVPVTVIVYGPGVTLEATVKVSVELPAPVMDVGLKPTVTPDGWPDAPKPIAESKPPTTLLVIVDPPALPCATETDVAEREKLGVTVPPLKSALIRLAPFGLPQPVARS